MYPRRAERQGPTRTLCWLIPTPLRPVIETDLRRVEQEAEAAGAPWTSGRLPVWKP